MSEFNPKELLDKLLQNKRIASRAKELNLNVDQLLESLPILIDMNDQVDDEFTKYLTSFFLDDENKVRRMEVRSTYWEKYRYLKNVISLYIEDINFDDEKDFIKEETRKPIINNIKQYLTSDKYIPGMYIYGQMGIGKTFILKRIAKKFAEQGYKIAFVSVSHLVAKVKASFSGEGSGGMLDLLNNVDYLFLDDIGSEPISSWFRDEFLFSILNYRMQNEKTTFFSSNVPMSKLEQIESRTINQKYRDYDKSARLISRVRSLANEFELKGNSKR